MTKSSVVDEFSKEKYENQNPIAKWLVRGFFKSLKNLYLQVPKKNRQNVLEVACGPGISTEKIYSYASTKRFVATDIEPDLVAETKKKLPNIQVDVNSIYDLNYKDGEFETVFALEVLEHLEEPEKAIKELARVTSTYAIISCPREPIWRLMNMARGKFLTDFGNTPGHIQNWGKSELKTLIEVEFEILSSEFPIPWQMYLCRKK